MIYARIELSHGPRVLAGEHAKTPSVSGGRLTCLLREMTTAADHSGQQRFHCSGKILSHLLQISRK